MNTANDEEKDVFYTANDEVYHPIIQNEFLMIIKLICCLIGIPLNIFIVVTIIRHRRLRCKLSTIFLLGIVLSYLSFFVPAVIELLYWGLYPIKSVCQSYVAVVAVPHGLLLFNMLLALVDKYVAIKYPVLRREKLTVCLACSVVIISSISTVFLMKFVYILRLRTLQCEIWFIHFKIMALILIILLVLCVALTVIVHRQLKTLSRRSQTPSPTDMFDDPHMAIVDIGNMEWIELTRVTNESQNDWEQPNNSNIALSEYSTTVRSMSIHVEMLSEREIEDCRTLIIGVTPLVIMAYCGIIFVTTFFACRSLGRLQCDDLSWMGPYIKELSLIPAFYGSLIFLTRNKELRSVYTCQKKSG